MNIRKSIKVVTASLFTYLAISQSCYAITVYADFDGDMLYDATTNVAPGSTITASVYAGFTAQEVLANGGLNGFGIDLTTGGLGITGDNINSIDIDPQWNFATILNISDPNVASARVVSNTLAAGGFSDLAVHLFDISLDVPAPFGATYTLSFMDVPGDSFVSNNAFVYDDFIVFAASDVTTVPVPGAAWLMLSGILGLIGVARRDKLTTT